jgi:hypothetical protein
MPVSTEATVIVPCPRCKSWNTMHWKEGIWICTNMDCQHTFLLQKHHVLLFKNGQCYRVDSNSPKDLRLEATRLLGMEHEQKTDKRTVKETRKCRKKEKRNTPTT